MALSVSRKPHLANKIVMVGGLDGCGKTLFSPIISALERVELPTYSYEIEHYCSLNFLQNLSLNAASTLIRMQTDLKLYNMMMGREVNFRPTDLSSVQLYHNPTQYFERLFKPGDEVIPDVVRKNNPILNLIIHNVLSISDFSGSMADYPILDLFFFCDLACSIIFLKSCLLISAIFMKFFILS